jgi:uncharacterized protein YgbK (DUF1537 family)
LIAKHAVEQTGIKRVVVAGGDTSSYAARAMQIEAVEMIAPVDDRCSFMQSTFK